MDALAGQKVTSVRRNGKLLSCEPCRKSKLRCDHLMPSCARCQRRGIASQCIYHPAPMTRRRTSDVGPPQPLGGENHVSHDIGATFELPSQAGDTTRPWRSTFPTPSQTESQETVSPPVQAAPITLPGYLGPTSYSAIFTENENNFEIASDGHALPDLAAEGLPRITSDQIERGAQALALFSNFALFERLVDRWYRVSQNMAMLDFMIDAVRRSAVSIRDVALKKPNNRQLRTLSEKISRSTMRPMQVPPACPLGQFTSLFTGENLRWEALGLYFTLVGQGAMSLPDSDSLDREYKDVLNVNGGMLSRLDKKQLGNMMISAGEMCATFADQAGNPNDLTVWMLYDLTILISLAHGDDNYQVWRRMGDLSTAVFALGLHEGIEANDRVPFYLAELRKREFCLAYSVDKLISTFLGRPPRITRRYCKFQLPAYLSDEEIIADEATRELALSKLDSHGWSTEGVFCRVLWTRSWMLRSIHREEILELYLGTDVDDDSVHSRVEEIYQHLEQTRDSMPAYLNYDPKIWTSGTPYDQCFTLLCVHFDRLYSDILLQRALIKRTGERSKTLVDLSRELLICVLTIGQQRDRILEYSCDFAWLICYYGLPSAGILAIELLKQTQLPPGSFPASEDEMPFSRSEAIQNLSVFISLLESIIRPGEANYVLSDRARKALKHTLDRVLSPPPMPSVQPADPPVLDSQDVPGLLPVNSNLFADFPLEDGFDFLNWIDTMDWDKGPWMTSINQM